MEHLVLLKLKAEEGSKAEKEMYAAAFDMLMKVPGVTDVSSKFLAYARV